MLITTLALSTMMLAGCGNGKNNNSVTSSATQEPEAEKTAGPVVNEDDSDYDESDMTGDDDGVVGDVVDDAADVVDDVADDTADVVDDATGNQGTDGTANNAGQAGTTDNANGNTATAKPKTTKKPNKKKVPSWKKNMIK